MSTIPWLKSLPISLVFIAMAFFLMYMIMMNMFIAILTDGYSVSHTIVKRCLAEGFTKCTSGYSQANSSHDISI